jgi:tetratricopeptide (TPR) repeat protein
VRILFACLLVVSSLAAQHQHSPSPGSSNAVILEGMGEVNHPVSTRNPEAQRFFNQGLALAYGFNHDEAARSFRRAAKLDPSLAMAWWGVSLVHGPNYNLPADAERNKLAWEALRSSQRLAPKAKKKERDYIAAIAQRYSADPNADAAKLGQAYKDAMCQVMKRYPEDLDAATLCAEAGMNLRPWALWNKDGTPAPGTEEILAILEGVLKRDPRHVGANHYYIHAVEGSPRPERGLASAQQLESLAPGAGHLVHMPAHIYLRTGDYSKAAEVNVHAAEADRAYIAKAKPEGVYLLMYFPHNMHFERMRTAWRATLRAPSQPLANWKMP